MSTQDYEALFVQNLLLIERLVASLAGRHGLRGEDAADCASWVKLRLIEDDYGIFRKFRGESALSTYLTVVVASLLRDYRVRQWGRWRPSAAARRRGALAIQLEALVYRNGYRFQEAVQRLRSAGDVQVSDRELATIFAELPVRSRPRPVSVGPEELDALGEGADPEDRVAATVAHDDHSRMMNAVATTLGHLDLEDRLILQMRYWDGLSLADIARGLHLEQKSLYRRFARLLTRVKSLLASNGFSEDEAHTVLDELSS